MWSMNTLSSLKRFPASVASNRSARTMSSLSPKVALIGLGQMGYSMLPNISKTHKVLVFDTNDETRKMAAEIQNVQIAQNLTDIGTSENCQVVFTMLPGCKAVDNVMETLASAIPEDLEETGKVVFVDCSTVSPITSRRWHSFWTARGHTMIDAPVSGGVKGATDGTLTFMAGFEGEEEGMALARPYLELMGKSIINCGKPGTGAATKLCNNLALAAQMIGICEALNLGEALDVDPLVLSDVLNTSTAKCWSSQVNNPHPTCATTMAQANGGNGPPASRDYQGGFGSSLMLKDLGLAMQAASEAGVALPITATGKELYHMIDLHGLGKKDFGVMLKFLKGKAAA